MTFSLVAIVIVQIRIKAIIDNMPKCVSLIIQTPRFSLVFGKKELIKKINKKESLVIAFSFFVGFVVTLDFLKADYQADYDQDDYQHNQGD